MAQPAAATAAPHVPPHRLVEQYTELAELAGRLVHEIKNHIGTLGLNLQLMAEDLQAPETPRERRTLQRAQMLQEECRRLTDLSNDFLRFARLRDLCLVPADLKEVLDEMIDFAGPSARQKRIEIKMFMPGSLPAVMLDRDLFKQAVLNLILNAEQAMPNGGELTVQAECRGDAVHLSFIDTGDGISPEVLPQIFQPFYTTRAGGSGLGLPTARKIIEAHGGQIDAQSECGRGTKFTVVLPCSPRKA